MALHIVLYCSTEFLKTEKLLPVSYSYASLILVVITRKNYQKKLRILVAIYQLVKPIILDLSNKTTIKIFLWKSLK